MKAAVRRAPRLRAADSLGFERLVFFSDAIFAIAITLLVIEVRLPDTGSIVDSPALLAGLWSLLPRYIGFLVSFVVIGTFWLSHHRMFELLRGYDAPLMRLNLLFLLFIAFMPFPTAVVGRYSFIPEAEALYAVWVAAAGLARLALWGSIARRGLLSKQAMAPADVRLSTVLYAAPVAVFLASVPLGWLHWLAPIVVWVLAKLATTAAGRLVVRSRRRRPARG